MIFHRIASAAKKLADFVQPVPVPTQHQRVVPWFKDNGDKTLRLDYDELNSNSLVFDLGGYEGQWASDIYGRYCCSIFIFEPYAPYATGIRKRFARNKQIQLFEFGLSAESQQLDLVISGDASSIYKTQGEKVQIKLTRALDFFAAQGITSVDLMKINIEGGEYDLLDHLISSGLISSIKNVQVQFHDFVPDAQSRMRRIQGGLAKTHDLTYQYEFVWENWRLK